MRQLQLGNIGEDNMDTFNLLILTLEKREKTHMTKKRVFQMMLKDAIEKYMPEDSDNDN